MRAKVIVKIFDAEAPSRREGPFSTAARRPSGLPLRLRGSGASLWDGILPEVRAAVERRQACALQKGARRIARCGGGDLRLPAFRFLHLLLEVLIGEARVTDERKAGPPLPFHWTEPVSR